MEAGNRFMDPSKSFKHVDLIELVMSQAKSKACSDQQDPAVQLLVDEQDEEALKQVQSRANQTLDNSSPAVMIMDNK